MNRPVLMAQLSGSTPQQNTAPPRVIKIAKPEGGQAQTVYLGYDQQIKLDLSAIASEKVTFVHVGERLVILFDNQSTLTIDPFFDSSSGAPRANMSFDVNGRSLDGAEFAGAFPITTDQSVLPAAGDAPAGPPASGANFGNAGVDPFGARTPLALLGQEELGNFVINDILTNIVQVDILPTGAGSISLLVDDQNLPTGSTPLGGPVTNAGTLSFAAGSEAITSLVFGPTSGLSASLVWTVSEDGRTLTGSDERGAVVRLTLTGATSIEANGTGTVTVTVELLANFDTHPGLNVDDLFNLGSINVVATDLSGDVATGQITLQVSDDVPSVAVGEGAIIAATVQEDGLSTATGDLSDGNRENGETDSDDEVSGAAGSLAGLFHAGADGPLTFSLSQNSGGLPALFSHGEQVVYSFNGNVLTASTSFGTVFTLTVNPNGSWSFDLNDQLDHVNDGTNSENFALRTSADGSTSVAAIDFSSIIVATDADGDSVAGGASGAFTIAVQDDIPVQIVREREGEGEGEGEGKVFQINGFVVEDALSTDDGDLSDGNLDAGQNNSMDEASGSGSNGLAALFKAGADEPLTFTVSLTTSGLPTLYSHGELVQYAVNGNVLTASTSFGTVFTLTVETNGSWSFDLQDQLDHVDGNGDFGTQLRTSAPGSEQVTSVNAIDFSSVIIATDSDGDSLNGLNSGSFTITVQNDVPVQIGGEDRPTVTAKVYEDSLATADGDRSDGNREGQTSSQDEASGEAGSLTALFKPGADENLTFTVSLNTSGLPTLYSHGELVQYAVNGNMLTASTSFGTVFTLTVNTNGSWSFDLQDQLDHVDGNGDAGTQLRTSAPGSEQVTSVNAIDFSSVIVATDADGDKVNGLSAGSFSIEVENDVPVQIGGEDRATVTAKVYEDSLSTADGDRSDGNREGQTSSQDEASGEAGSLTALFKPGADENLTFTVSPTTSGLPTLYSHGELVQYAVNGNVLTASTSFGTVFTLTVNTNGSWSFDLQDQLDHVDGNGDAGTQLRTSAPGSQEVTSVNAIDFSSVIVATDADGDKVNGLSAGSFSIEVENDVPVQIGGEDRPTVTAKVYEDSLSTEDGDLSDGNREGQTSSQDEASGGAGSLTALFKPGADENLIFTVSPTASGLPTLYSHDELVQYAVNGNVLTASTSFGTVFTLTVNTNGSWSFDLQDQLDHVDGSGDAGTLLRTSAPGVLPVTSVSSIDFSSVIVATDADGDKVNGLSAGSFSIEVENDVPVQIGGEDRPTVTATVLEDALSTAVEPTDLSEGNRDPSQTADMDTASGLPGSLTALFAPGADENLSFSVDTSKLSTLPTLYSNGELVTYSMVSGVLTATAGAGGQNPRVVFTLQVNADGSWSFDLDDQLDHVNANGDDGVQLRTSAPGVQPVTSVESIDFSSIITATDADGDKVNGLSAGSFTIAVQNDVPVQIGGDNRPVVTATVHEDSLSTSQGDAGDKSEGNREGQTLAQDEASGDADSLTALFKPGADEGLTFTVSPTTSGLPTLYSHGELVQYAVNGNVLTASTSFGTVFTLTVNSNGSWSFDLDDQLDHVNANGDSGFDLRTSAPGVLPVTSVSSIDFSSVIVATDADGDQANGLSAGSFTIAVENDVPIITARDAEETSTTTTETITFALRAGNADFRAMDGQGDHDILLTGEDLNDTDDSVNTNSGRIGVGDGQIIDGYESKGNPNKPNISGPEVLTLSFVNSLITQGNPNPSYSHSGSYDVSSVTFTIDVAEAQQIESAVLFIGAKDNGSFEDVTVKINNVTATGTPVYVGGNLVGYVFTNVQDGATVMVTGATPFDQLQIGNYNGYTFDSTAGGQHATLSGGNPFRVLGIESTITTTVVQTEVFRVAHDESAGVNTAADPNAASDTADAPPALIQQANALGYAKSTLSVLTLFNETVGADENATHKFSITDSNGNPLTNVPSGLLTLNGTAILLTTDGNGVLHGTANGADVFAVYVDNSGKLWIAQYQPIQHGLAGSSPSAFDEIATITTDLRVTATITDADGDTDTATSDVALRLDFQDDGPRAVDDQDSVTEDGPLSADGNVVTGVFGVDQNNTDGMADAMGADGFKSIEWANASNGVINGLYGTLTVGVDGRYTYTLYTQAQNPTAYATVQGLSAGETLSESFDYGVTDGDGDTAFATLSITVNGADDGVTIGDLAAEGGDTTVSEAGLPARGLESQGSAEELAPGANGNQTETNTGTFSFTSLDGFASLMVGTTTITLAQLQNATSNAPIAVAGGPAYGTLQIIGFSGTEAGGTVSYRFTLTDNTLLHTNTTNDATVGDRGTDDQVLVSYDVKVTDQDGSVGTGTLRVAVNDDGPTASNEVFSLTEGQTVNGTLDFLQGADSATVTHVNGQALVFGAGGWSQTISGAHGTLQVMANGTYRFVAQADDAYISGGTDQFSFRVTDGDNDTSDAQISVTVADDSDVTTVTLNDVTVNEGVGTATISASVNNAPQGTDLVLMLSNGATITIQAGQTTGVSTPFAIQGEDPYIDHETYEVSITGHSGGNYEALNTTDKSTVTVNDTIQTNFVTLDDVVVNENQPIVYTAHMNYATWMPFTITLSNGVEITFQPGQLTASSASQPAQGEDPYVDGQTYEVSIQSHTGANFENVNFTDKATVTINDTIQTNFVTLDDVVVNENQQIVYTAHMDYASLTPFTITLSNNVQITFAPGQLTASSAPQPAQGEDPYVDGESYEVSITGHSGGNFEALNITDKATVTINDTIQTNFVTLDDVVVNENQQIVYTAHMNYASLTPFTITLSNNVQITFAPGQLTASSAPQPAQGEDPYVDGESYQVSIASTSGGNFEALNITDTATVTINDTIQTNFVTLDDVVVNESQPIVYTAHMNYASLTPFTITLNNGVEITFAPGQTTASSLPQPAQGDDVYVDGQVIPVSIASTSGGNFEAVNITDTATMTITDTTDTSFVTLNDVTVSEGAGTATISASVNNAPQNTNLVLTLSNGATITILAGQTTGTSTAFAVQGDDPYVDHESYQVSVTTASGGNYESLNTTDKATVTINDTATLTTVTLNDVTVSEGAGTATITASVNNAPQTTNLVLTLNNGATITILAGQTTGTSTPFAVQGDDPYVDHESYQVSIINASGGNYEALDVTDKATVTVNDTTDTTVVTLNDVTVSEGAGTATITASVTNAPQATDLVLTLSNGATITILAGQTTGTSTAFAVQSDDPYVDHESYQVSVTTASGGNYEALDVTDKATVTVNDTTDTSFVTLNDVTVSEGAGTATISASVSNAPQNTNLVLTLSNGATITILAGQTTGTSTAFAVQGDDPYVDHESYQVSVTTATGGNYESLNTTDKATVTINDTATLTTVTLNDVMVSEGAGTATITASVNNAPQTTNLVLTLNNGATITILAGQTTGTSTPFAVQGDDPYVDHESYQVSIINASGGNYEALDVTDKATVTVNDTTDTTVVTLNDVTVSEGAGTATITASVTNAPQATDLVLTLSNGATITILAGQTTGTSTAFAVQGDDPYVDHESYQVSVTTASGGNYEALDVTDKATVTVNDTTDTTVVTLNDVSVVEGTSTATISATVSNVVTGTPLVITLSNNATITIAVGQTTGTSTPFAVVHNGDDVYIDALNYTVSVQSTSGGNFEALNTTDTATVFITDDVDPVTATLTATPTTGEDGGSITYTVTLSGGPGSVNATSAMTFTLSNSQVITIAAGSSSGSVTVPVNRDDVYKETDAVTAAITTHTGGAEFESLVVNTTPVSTTITDDVDPVTAKLTATPTTGEDGGSITYTVTLSGGPGSVNATSAMTFTLSNSQVITIAAGSSSGSVTVPVNRDDVYKETDAVTAAITTHTGGAEFESLVVNTDPVSTTITDDVDSVTATLTAGAGVLGPTGVTIPYTVTLSGGPGAFTPTDGDLTFTLANGSVVTIPQNGTSATVNVFYSYGTFTNPITNSISTVSGDNEYEHLATAGSTSINANTVPTVTGSVSLTVNEAGLDLTQDASPAPADLHAGVVTGTNPSSRSETAQGTGITFNATGETINVSFANPTGPNWVAPTVAGLASGYSIVWALAGSELVGTLWNTTTNTNLGASIYLALSDVTATAGNSVSPTVTVTLTDQLQHSAGSGNITINGLRVIATDSSNDVVSASVNVTVVDDRPTSFEPEQAALLNAPGRTITGMLDGDGSFDNNIGADQTGSVRFPSYLNNLYSGMTSGGLPINYTVSANGLVLTAVTSAGTVFTATLTPGATDSYTINMIGTVDGGATQVSFGTAGGYAFTGGNTPWVSFTKPAVGSEDLLLTPAGSAGTSINGTATDAGVSGQSSGGGGNEIGLNEALRLDYVVDVTGNTSTAGSHVFNDHYTVNGSSFKLNSASSNTVFRIEVRDDADGNDVVGDGARDSITAIAINFDGETEYVSRTNGLLQTVSVGSPGGATDRTFTVTFTDVGSGKYVAQISGANPTDVNFATYTADGYNSLEIHYVSGETFSLGGLGTSSIQNGNPVSFSLPVELVDADGDTSSSAIDVTLLPTGSVVTDHSGSAVAQNIQLTTAAPHAIGSSAGDNINAIAGSTDVNYVAGGDGSDNISTYGGDDHVWGQGGGDNIIAGDGNDIVFGGAGNDTIYGGAGNDILDGGADNDTLIGGAGIDTIIGGAGLDTIKFDQPTLTGNHDIINNYVGTGADRDVLDISALVDAAFGPGNNNVNNFVRVIQGGAVGDDIANNDPNDFLVQVDVNGATGGASFQTVAVLNGYNTSGLQTIAVYLEGQEYQFQTPV